MKITHSLSVGKLIAATGMVSAIFAFAGSPVYAFPAEASDTAVNAYLKTFVRSEGADSFIKGDQNGGKTGFWQEIEQIEGIEDANDRTGGAYKAQVTALLNGFVKVHGNNWSDNIYNDDIAWAVIAYTRGYEATGNIAFRAIAQSNFDMMFARAWDPAQGTLFWTTKNTSYNTCIASPAGIAAVLLSKALNDSSYLTRAQNLFKWNKENLFDATTGAVWDDFNIATGKINKWSSTYNQGTFIGLANYLGDTATAKLAADYTMNRMGKRGAKGFMIMPEYGAGGGNNAGFNSIGLRWISKFMKERRLEATYLPWMQANADAAWDGRRASDGLSWCQWLQPTPESLLHSWDTISSVVAFQVVPPNEKTPKP